MKPMNTFIWLLLRHERVHPAWQLGAYLVQDDTEYIEVGKIIECGANV